MNDGCSDGHLSDSNASDDASATMRRQTLQIISEDDSNDQRLQSMALYNTLSSPLAPSSGATIVQYTQGPDGQYFIPVHQLNASGRVMSFSQGGVMVASGGGGIDDGLDVAEDGDEATRRRELRLLKNKEAAKECRRKKKEYVRCLENRVAVLENQNKTLIDELKSLKELYCQKDSHS